MPNVTCPHCRTRLQLKDIYAGRRIRCVACEGVLTVPSLPASGPLADPGPPVAPPAPPAQPVAVQRTTRFLTALKAKEWLIGPAELITYSRDGSRALFVTGGNTIQLWDVDEVKELYRFTSHTRR